MTASGVQRAEQASDAVARRQPATVKRLAAGVVLDLSADSFLLFTLLWVAAPQGWTGAKTALIVVALRVPAVLIGAPGGRAIDRYGPRPILLGQALVRIGCLTTLALCSWTGRYPLPLVLGLGALAGAVVPLSYASARTLVPRLVEPPALPRANQLLTLGDQAALLIGAAFVGPLLAAVGPGPALLTPVAMLTAATALFLTLPNSALPSTEPADVGDVGDGSKPRRPTVRTPWRQRHVVALIALSAAYYFAYGPIEPALPYFIRQQLHAGDTAYSALWVAFGIGALTGLTSAARLTRYRPGLVNAAGAATWALVTLPLLACTTLPAAAIVMAISGAVWGPYLAVEVTALQRWTDPAVHGRLFGTQHAVLALAGPLGAAAGSLALTRVTSTTVLAASILACLAAGLAALTNSRLRTTR